MLFVTRTVDSGMENQTNNEEIILNCELKCCACLEFALNLNGNELNLCNLEHKGTGMLI